MKHAIKQCSHTIESTSVMAYYNENDKFAAAWLRELIKAGHICEGVVDERDVRDVLASDLRGYSQHHFFAGIGGWSHALRLTGWPDSRPVWTGSCPCQPFSPAGKGLGFADKRHLWPAFFHLIAQCRPDIIFGEQVEKAVSHKWLDLVSSDLEREGYAIRAAVLGAHSVGAAHKRNRLYWVADSECERERHEPRGMGAAEREAEGGEPQAGDKTTEDAEHRGAACDLGNSQCDGSPEIQELGKTQEGRRLREPEGSGHHAGPEGNSGHVSPQGGGEPGGDKAKVGRPNHLGGSFWHDCYSVWCSDEKYRPAKRGIFPLVDGPARGVGRVRDPGASLDVNATAEARIGRLVGYGNAIVPQTAEAFIRAYLMPDEKPLSVLSTILYPGRKQWFVPRAADFFRVNPCQTLIEPFAGSGVVGLSLLDAGAIDRLVLVEKDQRIACLLKGLLEEPDLADRYAAFRCTRANVEALMRTEQGAFRWLVQSRCSNRGIFSGGLWTRIDSRWCRNFVVGNIRRVYAMRDRIEVIEGDGLKVMRSYADDPSVGCFADPPYTADAASKGHYVYSHHKLNHQKLFSSLAGWRGPWLLTEDNSQMVRRLALCYRFASEQILMTTAENTKKKELVLWRERRVF